METLKIEIIRLFEAKTENFKKSLSREFIKPEPTIAIKQIYKYRDILIYDLFKDLTNSENSHLNKIESPLEFIETTLFNYITSEK